MVSANYSVTTKECNKLSNYFEIFADKIIAYKLNHWSKLSQKFRIKINILGFYSKWLH